MQDNKLKSQQETPIVMKLLKEGLEKLNKDVTDDETMKLIAKKAGCSFRTVRRYLRDSIVSKRNLGTEILKHGNKVVKENGVSISAETAKALSMRERFA